MVQTTDVKKYLIEEKVLLNPFEIKEHRIANIMPMMNNEEFDELVQDIQMNGQLEPIFVVPITNPNSNFKYLVVDGRNRVKACKELEIDIIANIYKNIIPNELLKKYVGSIHKRRNLTPDQKAYRAYTAWKKAKEEGKKINQKEISKQYGVNNKQLSYITKISKILTEKHIEDIYLHGFTSIFGLKFNSYKKLYDYLKSKENKEKDINEVLKAKLNYEKLVSIYGENEANRKINKIKSLVQLNKEQLEDFDTIEKDMFFNFLKVKDNFNLLINN